MQAAPIRRKTFTTSIAAAICLVSLVPSTYAADLLVAQGRFGGSIDPVTGASILMMSIGAWVASRRSRPRPAR